MALDTLEIQNKLQEAFGQKVNHFRTEYGVFVLEAEANSIVEILQFMKEDKTLNFHFLTDLCGVHYPENDVNEQFCVVYHLHNWFTNTRIRVKTFISGTQPELPSITSLFESANWMERETYDFYGIIFTGHPNLVRILNMDEMVSFPLRKEFPMEDSGRTDKDDRFFGRTINNC